MMKGSPPVSVFAPATVANLGPGFDVLGLALAQPGDEVTAWLEGGEPGVTIESIEGDAGALPLDPARNTAAVAAAWTLRRAGAQAHVRLRLKKGMPLGSGLGSSAASAAAAALATNLLLGSPLRKRELIGPCVEAEAVVSGRHADNVAPALLGGLILVRSVDPLDVVRLPVPEGLTLALVTPDFSLPTRLARQALPKQVALGDMVQNMANVAALVSACYSGDMALLGRCVQDEIVTPARAALIPGAQQVMDGALDAGALGTSISGAGPSVFALCRSPRSAREVSQVMVRAFEAAGLRASAILSAADCPGARRLS